VGDLSNQEALDLEALNAFQNRLLALDKHLEASMSGFVAPGEEY
jgi:hypothetical protein